MNFSGEKKDMEHMQDEIEDDERLQLALPESVHVLQEVPPLLPSARKAKSTLCSCLKWGVNKVSVYR